MTVPTDDHGATDLVRAFSLWKSASVRYHIDLPAAWSVTHTQAEVRWERTELFGWHVELCGDDGATILHFPWEDNADETLLGEAARSCFPLALDERSWHSMEQGWQASAIQRDADVYIAQTSDELGDDLAQPPSITLLRPGVVSVSGIEVYWNRVPRDAHDAAWQRALAEARRLHEDGPRDRQQAPTRGGLRGYLQRVLRRG
jgi:hypothetical protein